MSWYRAIWFFVFFFSGLASEASQNFSETLKNFYDQFGIPIDSERGALLTKELNTYWDKKSEKKTVLLEDCFFPATKIPFFIKIASEKDVVGRVYCAAACAKVIQDNQLMHLAIPKKWAFKDARGICCAVAEYVEDMVPLKNVSAEEIEDIIFFAKETGYSDWLCNNVMRCEKTGKIVFIDTEKRSFQGYYDDSWELLRYILQKNNSVALMVLNDRIRELNQFNSKPIYANYYYYMCVYSDEDARKLYNLYNFLNAVESEI